jgi:intracellular septation protein A
MGTERAAPYRRPMRDDRPLDPITRVAIPSLRELARRAVPQALEAAIVPAVLYLVAAQLAGTRVAIVALLAWAIAVVSWRASRGRRVSGMIVLALVTLLARSLIAFAAESTFLYFVQPALGGVALACAFLGSVVIDRPLVRRFAADFCVLPHTVLHHPAVHRCFRRLSVMWGAYGLANAALGFWMLVALPTAVFVALRTLSSIVGTACMVAVSAVSFRRVVERGIPLAIAV